MRQREQEDKSMMSLFVAVNISADEALVFKNFDVTYAQKKFYSEIKNLKKVEEKFRMQIGCTTTT